DFVEFNDRFVDALMNTLLKSGAKDLHMDAAHRYLRPLQVVAQCNRSAQGTLNQIKLDLEHVVLREDVHIAEITGYRVGAWLADRPTVLKGRQVVWPRDAFLELLATLAASGTPAAPVSNVEDRVRELPDNVVSMQAFRKRSLSEPVATPVLVACSHDTTVLEKHPVVASKYLTHAARHVLAYRPAGIFHFGNVRLPDTEDLGQFPLGHA